MIFSSLHGVCIRCLWLWLMFHPYIVKVSDQQVQAGRLQIPFTYLNLVSKSTNWQSKKLSRKDSNWNLRGQLFVVSQFTFRSPSISDLLSCVKIASRLLTNLVKFVPSVTSWKHLKGRCTPAIVPWGQSSTITSLFWCSRFSKMVRWLLLNQAAKWTLPLFMVF